MADRLCPGNFGGSRLGVFVAETTTPSACPHAKTTLVCIERDGFVANFSAWQHPARLTLRRAVTGSVTPSIGVVGW